MMDLQAEYAPTKTVKLLYSQICTSFIKANTQKLTSLFKQLYNDAAYNTNAQRWKITINYNDFQQNTLGNLFIKLLQNIKTYQLQKLKKGINYAFKLHLDVLSIILKILDEFKNQDDIWLCKPLRQIIRNTKKIFLNASKKDQESGGAVSVRKDDLIIKLQQFRTRKSLQQEVKKQILPLIDNMQVSIMLVYHSYDQIQRILKNTKSYGQQGQAFINNHLFQKGKTAMIYEQFSQAEKYFQQISLRTKGQKRLVLKYLIPCKMFLGKNFVANPQNNQQHFSEYQLIIRALNKAKFIQYNQAIKRYQKLWIKRGIYLLMDKLRIILWRNLLKKVYNILGDCKLNMQKIHKAVKLSGGQQSLQECVCIISNLIYEGKLKGYIFQNQEQKVLVLKKDGEGFPSLSK